MRISLFTLFFIFLSSFCLKAFDEPRRELRAVWLTSVYNIDWPQSSSVSAENQINRLKGMLDVLQETNINAVFFQVRPNADALYQSAYEPWSQWITGNRGQDPGYDPLALVIREANKRGMEVHAWLNPYRFENIAGQYTGLPGDYSQSHPELIITHDNRTYFNPGLPATTQLIKNIVADLVSHYDLDGVVFDDYFYPSGLPLSADQEAFDAYGTPGFINAYYPEISRGNFRRASVNHMIREVNDTIKSIRPSMVFGVSPAGIYSTNPAAAANWGTTLPEGITGRDNWSAIYCDPLAWLHDGSVDYLSPQLYWQIGGPQDYLTLVEWWGKEATRKGRHSYPSIASYRLPTSKKSERSWDSILDLLYRFAEKLGLKKEEAEKNVYSLEEIENQIMANRANEENNVLGTIFFSTRDLTSRVPELSVRLSEDLFAEKSIFPLPGWLPTIQPGAPLIEEIGSLGEDPDAAALQIRNSPASRFLLYGWEQPPAKTGKTAPDFMQLSFGRDFSLFYHRDMSYFAVAELLPNREMGFVSEPVAFTYLSPVEIIGPDSQEVCHMSLFSWTEVAGSESYQVLIARRQNPSEIVYASPLLSSPGLALPDGLLEGQQHYVFRVRGVSQASVSYSAPSGFFTAYPPRVRINAPANGAVNIPLTITVQWDPVPGATHYQLQIATSSSFADEEMVLDQDGVTTNFAYAVLDEAGREHYVRVRASNACGRGMWPEANRFTTTAETFVKNPSYTALTAYPNPASDRCYAEYPRLVGERIIEIRSGSGQLLETHSRSTPAESDTFELSHLPQGIYTIWVRTAEKDQYVIRIIKAP